MNVTQASFRVAESCGEFYCQEVRSDQQRCWSLNSKMSVKILQNTNLLRAGT